MSWDFDASAAVIERWLENAPGQEDPESVLGRVLAELDDTPQHRHTWLQPDLRRFVIVGLAAALVVVVVIVGIASLPGSRNGAAPGHSAPAGASDAPVPSGDLSAGDVVLGIAPEGAIPTDPEPADLLLSLESNIVGSPVVARMYADGRVLWLRSSDASGNPAGSGFVERRLTADGIRHVRSMVLETGMVDHDLFLSRESLFFDLRLREDGRSVRVVWARTEDWGLGPAREASAEEAAALGELHRQLQQRDGLPAWVWADAEQPHVPALNAVCLRSRPLATQPAHLWGALPANVAAFVRTADRSTPESSRGPSCASLTIADTHELVRLLDAAGVDRSPQTLRQTWLRYRVHDRTVPGNDILIMFGPVLPDGEMYILGPQ